MHRPGARPLYMTAMDDPPPAPKPAVRVIEPLPLEYAGPRPPDGPVWGDDTFLRVIRQVVFAIGLALLSAGLGSALAGVNRYDVPYMMGWGGGLMGLAIPLRRWSDK